MCLCLLVLMWLFWYNWYSSCLIFLCTFMQLFWKPYNECFSSVGLNSHCHNNLSVASQYFCMGKGTCWHQNIHGCQYYFTNWLLQSTRNNLSFCFCDQNGNSECVCGMYFLHHMVYNKCVTELVNSTWESYSDNVLLQLKIALWDISYSGLLIQW